MMSTPAWSALGLPAAKCALTSIDPEKTPGLPLFSGALAAISVQLPFSSSLIVRA